MTDWAVSLFNTMGSGADRIMKKISEEEMKWYKGKLILNKIEFYGMKEWFNEIRRY